MRRKGINGKGAALTVVSAVGAYALFSFLGALLCLWEKIGGEEAGSLYFAIGAFGVFCSGLLARVFLKTKKIWAVLAALLAYAATAFLCCESKGATAQVWIYSGCVAGAVAALMAGVGERGAALHRGKKRRKK